MQHSKQETEHGGEEGWLLRPSGSHSAFDGGDLTPSLPPHRLLPAHCATPQLPSMQANHLVVNNDPCVVNGFLRICAVKLIPTYADSFQDFFSIEFLKVAHILLVVLCASVDCPSPHSLACLLGGIVENLSPDRSQVLLLI